MRWRVDPSTTLLLIWALFILYGTLIPFQFSGDLDQAVEKLHALGDTLNRPISRSDVVSNVLLFLPFGGLYAFRPRQGRGRWTALLGATLSGMALSGFVETCQLFAPSRTTSLIDLATNTAGAGLGALAGWEFRRWLWPSWSRRLSWIVQERPVAACALAVAAGLLLAGLSPFDVSIELGQLRSAVKQAHPVPFGPSIAGESSIEPWSWAQEAVSAVLSGALFCLAWKEAGQRGVRGVALTAALGGALAFLIELAQLAITSRVTDMTSVFLALVGSASGGAIVTWGPPRSPRQWAGPAIVLWLLAVALAAWTPPRLTAFEDWSLHAWQLVPFWTSYQQTDVNALADLLNQVMSFVPLGVLVAVRSPRLSLWQILGIGLGIGAVLEIGQIGLADRTAEITDALSGGAGAYLGALLWRRAVASRISSEGPARYRIASPPSR